MNIRRLIIAALAVSMTLSAFGALSPQIEAWGKSGVHFLFTEEEEKAWKAVATDEQARAFADLFWARRDPTPATPKNEYREVIEERIRYADEHFTATGRKKTPGSVTDRGMMLIVFGQPTKAGSRGTSVPTTGMARESEQAPSLVWIYEGETARTQFGVSRVEFRFTEARNAGEFALERVGLIVDLVRARKSAVAAAITQPQLTKAPEFRTVPMAGSAVPAPAPVQALTALATPALASAVTDLKAAKTDPYAGSAFVSWVELVTPAGEYFVPVSLYLPKSSPAANAQNATFFGVLEDESGKPVFAFEDAATLTATKEDFFVDKSLIGVPAGKYRGYFGVAAEGKPLALAMAEMQLSGSLDKSAVAISPLILSNNVYPLTQAQGPTDPFAFGGTKVVPKSDKVFRVSTDELWYFFELRNPGLAEPPAPAEGTVPADTAAPAAEAKPKVQLKIDITGKAADGTNVKKSAPLAEADVISLRGVPGHFAVGSAFPLSIFKPGDYTIAIRVIDTVSKASYSLSGAFKVVE